MAYFLFTCMPTHIKLVRVHAWHANRATWLYGLARMWRYIGTHMASGLAMPQPCQPTCLTCVLASQQWRNLTCQLACPSKGWANFTPGSSSVVREARVSHLFIKIFTNIQILSRHRTIYYLYFNPSTSYHHPMPSTRHLQPLAMSFGKSPMNHMRKMEAIYAS
jgi:hypothetical protein